MVPLLWILHDGSFLRAVMWLCLFVMGYYATGLFCDGLLCEMLTFYGSLCRCTGHGNSPVADKLVWFNFFCHFFYPITGWQCDLNIDHGQTIYQSCIKLNNEHLVSRKHLLNTQTCTQTSTLISQLLLCTCLSMQIRWGILNEKFFSFSNTLPMWRADWKWLYFRGFIIISDFPDFLLRTLVDFWN